MEVSTASMCLFASIMYSNHLKIGFELAYSREEFMQRDMLAVPTLVAHRLLSFLWSFAVCVDALGFKVLMLFLHRLF